MGLLLDSSVIIKLSSILAFRSISYTRETIIVNSSVLCTCYMKDNNPSKIVSKSGIFDRLFLVLKPGK